MTSQLTKKKYYEKLIKKFIQLQHKSMEDQMIYGESYLLFTERGIEVVNPTEITRKVKLK
jgi:hypothetical protein